MDRMLSSIMFAIFLAAVLILVIGYSILPERIKSKLYNFTGSFI